METTHQMDKRIHLQPLELQKHVLLLKTRHIRNIPAARQRTGSINPDAEHRNNLIRFIEQTVRLCFQKLHNTRLFPRQDTKLPNTERIHPCTQRTSIPANPDRICTRNLSDYICTQILQRTLPRRDYSPNFLRHCNALLLNP